jgi:hypothetical protein
MRNLLLASTLLVMVGGCVSTGGPPIPDVALPMITDPSTVNPIAIERLVVQARGQAGVIGMGLLCIPHGTLRAGGGSNGGYLEAMETIQHEFNAIGYPVTTSTTELFTTARSEGSRLRLAGLVTDVNNNVCFPLGGFGDTTNGSADAMVTIEWQVFDSLTKDIALKLSTTGFAKVSQTSEPLLAADEEAVRMSVRHFIGSPEFQRLAHTMTPSASPELPAGKPRKS